MTEDAYAASEEVEMEIRKLTGAKAQLYRRYASETQAQPVHVEIDCKTGVLTAGIDPEVGGAVPQDVWNSHRLWFKIPALCRDDANALIDRLAPLAERVIAGYSSGWNGHNHVGQSTADADVAIDETARICGEELDERQAVQVWTAQEFFSPLGEEEVQARELGITADTTEEQLRGIAERELHNAQDVDAIECLDEYLVRLREAVTAKAA